MSAVLDIQGLAVSFGGSTAVDKVSMHLNKAEVVALVGANGAGKSSTLKAILGLVPISSGRILLGSQDLHTLPTRRRVAAGIALSPEGRRVFQSMTVTDNLLTGYLAGQPSDRSTRRDFVEAMFPILRERRSQLAGTLSGGEQQMLAIARALMSNPSVLMLDEPTLGLAPVIVEKVKEIIVSLKRNGMTILLAEQNVEMALSISDRGYVLENGRVAMSAASEVLARDEAVKSAYLGL
jgi:branched-chain amino acid transport system ATP-binding protein